MKRKWKVLVPVLFVCLLVSAWFEPTGVVRGWLRGEAFYQGRPTNYWSRELARWQYNDCFFFLDLSVRTSRQNTLVLDHDLIDEPIDVVDLIGPHQDSIWIDAGRDEAAFDIVTLNHLTTRSNLIFPRLGTYQRSPGLMDKLAAFFRFTLQPDDPPTLLSGDPEAEAVLRELLDDANQTVREHAQRALDEIRRANPW